MDDIQLAAGAGSSARIAPEAGFCCLSWTVDGGQHLHLPVGEEEFRRKPKTGGVPLLYPYANRLRSDPWPDRPDVKRDGGLPCHGFLLRFSAWDQIDAAEDQATVVLDWAAHEELMSLFPYAHRLETSFQLGERSLRATTVVEANGGDDVPISFGWHPYLALPGVSHDQLELALPPLKHVHMDDQGIPVRDGSGALVEDEASDFSGSLAGRSFDDLYRLCEPGGSFELRGGNASLRLELDENWGFVQLYSPDGADFACMEPMTAPVAALSDGRDHPTVAAGERFEASFELSLL